MCREIKGCTDPEPEPEPDLPPLPPELPPRCGDAAVWVTRKAMMAKSMSKNRIIVASDRGR